MRWHAADGYNKYIYIIFFLYYSIILSIVKSIDVFARLGVTSHHYLFLTI